MKTQAQVNQESIGRSIDEALTHLEENEAALKARHAIGNPDIEHTIVAALGMHREYWTRMLHTYQAAREGMTYEQYTGQAQ